MKEWNFLNEVVVFVNLVIFFDVCKNEEKRIVCYEFLLKILDNNLFKKRKFEFENIEIMFVL